MNGIRSFKTIFNKVRKDLNNPGLGDKELREDFAPVYRVFNNIGWILLRHRSVSPFVSLQKLQKRVSKMYPLA
jgi:hypothetical protein